MITFPPGYARLELRENQGSQEVRESIEHLLRVCCMNAFQRALVVTDGHSQMCLHALAEAIRFYPPTSLGSMRLALVALRGDATMPGDLLIDALAAGLACAAFTDEPSAVRWLMR